MLVVHFSRRLQNLSKQLVNTMHCTQVPINICILHISIHICNISVHVDLYNLYTCVFLLVILIFLLSFHVKMTLKTENPWLHTIKGAAVLFIFTIQCYLYFSCMIKKKKKRKLHMPLKYYSPLFALAITYFAPKSVYVFDFLCFNTRPLRKWTAVVLILIIQSFIWFRLSPHWFWRSHAATGP